MNGSRIYLSFLPAALVTGHLVRLRVDFSGGELWGIWIWHPKATILKPFFDML